MRINRGIKRRGVYLQHAAIGQCLLTLVLIELRHYVRREALDLRWRRGFRQFIRAHKPGGVASGILHHFANCLITGNDPIAAKGLNAGVFRIAREAHDVGR